MTPRLMVDRVTRQYGSHIVLREVTFSCNPGEAIGVIGPNGAGKTTMLRVIVGLLRPHSGRVCVDEDQIPTALARTRISYFAGEATVPAALRAGDWSGLFLGAGRKRDRRSIRQLSRGTRQMLGLRAALGVPGARLIVLDEPWEGLDPDGARWLSEAIKARVRQGAAVIVSSHRLHDLASVCDRFVFLDRGTATSISEVSQEQVTGERLLTMFDAFRGDPRR